VSAKDQIAAQYPNKVTGTLNRGIAVLPLPYEELWSSILSQWRILSKTNEASLPGL